MKFCDIICREQEPPTLLIEICLFIFFVWKLVYSITLKPEQIFSQKLCKYIKHNHLMVRETKNIILPYFYMGIEKDGGHLFCFINKHLVETFV